MALKQLFTVSGYDPNLPGNRDFDVKFDDVTLLVAVYDPLNGEETLVAGATHGYTGVTIATTDSNGVAVYFKGITDSPYAQLAPAGTFIRNQCYGTDLYQVVTNSSGREVQGTLVEANASECGYNPPVIIEETVTHATCFGSATASISLLITSGVAPFTFAWSDGAIGSERSNLTAGTYIVTVTDSHNTVGTKTIVINQNTEITVTATVDDDSITLAVSGGVAPYTYLWENGSTAKDRLGVVPGNYEVTVTDSAGCFKVLPISFSEARFYFSHAPILLQLQAADVANKPNLTFLCEVWVEKDYLSGVFEKVSDLEHVADKDGSTVFEVQEFLQPYLTNHFPVLDQSTVSLADGVFKRFYLQHREKYGLTPATGPFTVVDQRYVLRGGLGFTENARERFYTSYLATQQPFLSWLPLTKLATAQQPEFLYLLLHQAGISAFDVKLRTTYADDTTAVTTLFTQANCLRYEVYCIPTGYGALNLAAAGKEVKSWQVWCETPNGVALTETRTYSIDTRYFKNRHYLLYSNSLGGVNTLAATGLADTEMNVKAETLQRLLNANYNTDLGSATITSVLAEPVLRLTSGYVDSRQELEALTDFVLSREVRIAEGATYKAGVKEVKKFTLYDDGSDLKYVDFDFILPAESHYTPPLF